MLLLVNVYHSNREQTRTVVLGFYVMVSEMYFFWGAGVVWFLFLFLVCLLVCFETGFLSYTSLAILELAL